MVSMTLSNKDETHKFDETEFSEDINKVLAARFVLFTFKTVDKRFGEEGIASSELVAFSSFLRATLMTMLRVFGEGVPERAYRRAMTDVYLDEVKNSRFSEEINIIFGSSESGYRTGNDHNSFSILYVATGLQKLDGFGALNFLRSEAEALKAHPIVADTLAEKVSPSHFAARLDLAGQIRSAHHYRFWREWYQGFLDGEPLDWELQRRVALIDEAIWEIGPEVVAQEIEKIRTKFELEQRIKELDADLRRATVNRHGIGGNMPPEMLDDAPIAQELVIVWQPLQDLKDEITKDNLDTTHLQKIVEALLAALRNGFAWCLKKGDLIVDTAIKWAIPASGTGYFALNPEKLEAVIEGVKKLLVII